MKMDDKNRLRAVLAGDLEPGPAVVWAFLRHCLPQGSSVITLKRTFKDSGLDVQESVDILLEFGLVRKSGIKIKAADAPVEKTPDGWRVADGGVVEQDVGIDALRTQYDAWRVDRGTVPWPHREGDRKHWANMLAVVKAEKIDFTEYLDVMAKAIEGWSDTPHGTPGLLCGDFIQQKWATRDDWMPRRRKLAGKTAAGHAGAEYRPTKALRRQLERAGFDVTSEQARYLDDLATQRADDPTVRIPKKWIKAVQWMGENR